MIRMIRLGKIFVGVLVAALLGSATGVEAVSADQRQPKEPLVSPWDALWQPVNTDNRQRVESGGCQRSLVLPALGTEMMDWRVAEPVKARAVMVPLVVSAQTKGKITSLQLDKSELVLKDNPGRIWTFFVAKDCKVSINNKEAQLSDLQVNDEAVVAHQMRGLIPLVAFEIRSTRR